MTMRTIFRNSMAAVNGQQLVASFILAASSVTFAQGASAAEATLGSVIFSSQKTKIDGDDAGTTSTFGVAGRYHDVLDQATSWYATTEIAVKSYSSGTGVKAPDNHINLALGGGARYYFAPFSPSAVPFGFAAAAFKSAASAVFTSNGYTETAVMGLFHTAGLGLRMALDDTIFFELESSFYESPLYAITKITTQTGDASRKEETTSMELFAKTFGPFDSVILSLGVKL